MFCEIDTRFYTQECKVGCFSLSIGIYRGLSEYMFHFLGEILVAVTGEIRNWLLVL